MCIVALCDLVTTSSKWNCVFLVERSSPLLSLDVTDSLTLCVEM